MSKAFVREDADSSDEPVAPVSALPPGTRNLITPDGALRLRAELRRLLDEERPRWSGLPRDADTKRELEKLDRRIRHLQQSLFSAEIVPVPAPPHLQVRFGATVTVRDSQGVEAHYRIVGVDELDSERGWVSWLSPLARALQNAPLGERVTFATPSGPQELEIVAINYPAA
ncbi:MAG: GreA/GreB family elongation factor [Verrucomicrobia bacterium]|nr:GreA/GreB family elongation factor [Verrucomicrobiota bacterium]